MSTVREIRDCLVAFTKDADDKAAEITSIKKKIERCLGSLSRKNIVDLVESIRSEIESEVEIIRKREKKIAELNAQLVIIQDHCLHSDEEIKTRGNIEFHTCKTCGYGYLRIPD